MLPSGFKSGILLSIAIWIKQHNNNFKPKDPEKRPTILFITQENTIDETVERMFAMTVGGNIRDYNVNEVIELLRNEGKFTLDDENNIDIVFQYYGNEAIDTGHLYTIASELEEEGREIITVIHDYIGRIRTVDKSKKETKDKLGAISNEFKNFAIEYDIPFITASQLNREGARLIDSAAECQKEDLARLLGRANVGESWALIQNVDFACIINKEYSNLFKRWFLTFKRIKLRYAQSDVDYFNHPFSETISMQLLEDIDGESLSKFSLSSNLDEDLNEPKSKNAVKRKVVDNSKISDFGEFEKYLENKKKTTL